MYINKTLKSHADNKCYIISVETKYSYFDNIMSTTILDMNCDTQSDTTLVFYWSIRLLMLNQTEFDL